MKKQSISVLNRRDFLLKLSIACAALPLVTKAGLQQVTSDTLPAQIENAFFSVAFDVKTGSFFIRRKQGPTFLSNAIVRVQTAEELLATNLERYRHSTEKSTFSDGLGEGRQLIIRSKDKEKRLDIELGIVLYPSLSAVFIEAICRNVSMQPVTLQYINPLCAVIEEKGSLNWPQASKLLTNGAMYYDPGMVTGFYLPEKDLRRSWWNIGVFRGYRQEGLVCGAIENQTAQGQILTRREPGNAISLVFESELSGVVLQPGKQAHSNRFMMNIGTDPYAALEEYASVMGTLQGARIHSVVNGWCNWSYTYGRITEEEVLLNAEFAARVLKPFGMEYIQVDEGYQCWHGDWEGNDRFPHGMKWLADKIRALGLEPGIWIAPYVISEPTELFHKHPDWLIRHPDGRLKRVGPWPSEDTDLARNENPKRYGLDITHPEAAKWLYDLFDKVANTWGFKMIKIDFVDWSLLSADQYHDPTVSRAAAYRKGFEIMRKAIGPDCHLLDCGPGPVTVGLLDSMRIELDQSHGSRKEVWKQYFLNSASSAPAAAKRYYFHKRTWINDADHVCLNLLSTCQAQAAASLIALTGGNIVSSDRLPDLDATRLEILKKILPSTGEAARPVDLFDTDTQSIFALKIKKNFGEWTVIGLFNSSETEVIERVLPLDRLWLDPGKSYLAYDFWEEQLLGEITSELQITIQPASVTLLLLHEKRGIPQVLATDRHVISGYNELEQVNWNETTRTLSGISTGPLNSAHNVAVYIPEPHPSGQGAGAFMYHDFPGYSLKMMDDHMLRVHVRFSENTRVTWKVFLTEFFGEG
jgi:Melibiase